MAGQVILFPGVRQEPVALRLVEPLGFRSVVPVRWQNRIAICCLSILVGLGARMVVDGYGSVPDPRPVLTWTEAAGTANFAPPAPLNITIAR